MILEMMITINRIRRKIKEGEGEYEKMRERIEKKMEEKEEV